MEVRNQALDEERKRREDLEKRLQEETSRRQKLIDREVKLREKQRAQVGKKNTTFPGNTGAWTICVPIENIHLVFLNMWLFFLKVDVAF